MRPQPSDSGDSTERPAQAACLLDPRGRISWVNEGWRRTAAQHAGSPFANGEGSNYIAICRAAPPERQEAHRMAAELERLLLGAIDSFELEYSCECEQQHRTGIARVAAITLGSSRCAFVTHDDVTTLRSRERELRASEERYRQFFEAAPDAAFVVAADGPELGRILDANGMACTMHGMSREEMLGRYIGDLDVPEDAALVAERIARLRRDGQASFETSHLHRDGSRFPIEVSARTATIAGRPVIVSFNRDLRQRRAVEQALHEQKLRLELAVRASCVGFWDWDLRTDAVYFSPEWKAQLGYSPAEILDEFESWRSRVHPEDLPSALTAVREHRSGRSPFYATEFRMRHRDGSYRWIYARGQLTHDTTGQPARLVGCHIDITAQKQAAREQAQLAARLGQMQRLEAIGTLAGGIAHDFNNILGIIVGNAELAQLDPENGPLAQEALDEIRRAGERARSLVRQILAFSRDEAPQRQPVRPGAVLDEAVRLLRATIPHSIAITSDIAAALPQLMADGDQLHQVLVNLGTNAWHAIGDRCGHIRLGVHADGDTVEFVVADDGCGMSEAVRERIFEPFFTTKNAGQGTGLGLSVVHGIVQNHGGTIEVTSAPGAGATFVVRLPAGRAAPEVPDPAPNAPCTPRSVLLIDDEPQLLEVLRRGLERHGHRVSAHTDPDEALAALQADPGFEVVVTDFDMPGRSGLEVSRTVHAMCPSVPTLLSSGYLEPATIERLGDAGVVRIVPKPASAGDLADAIAQAAGRAH